MKMWSVKEHGFYAVRIRAWTPKGARRHYRRHYAEVYPRALHVIEVTPEEIAWEEEMEARADAASY